LGYWQVADFFMDTLHGSSLLWVDWFAFTQNSHSTRGKVANTSCDCPASETLDAGWQFSVCGRGCLVDAKARDQVWYWWRFVMSRF
jgi:hypothetical protein